MMRRDGGVFGGAEIKKMMIQEGRCGAEADGGFYMRMTPCGSD